MAGLDEGDVVKQMKRRHGKLSTPIALATALLLAGCGGGGDGSGETATRSGNGSSSSPAASAGVPSEIGLVGVTESDAEPQRGGVLTVGVWAEARGLDPAKSPSSGVLGAMETAAIYGVLVRYDPDTGDYEPWMAKSLEHNEDYSTWTLELREGMEFSDGTPLNSEAVVFSFERAKGKRYDALVSQVESMDTPDEQTVVFHLKEPWSNFPYVLSVGPGRVPSPTAAQKWGEDFGAHPVGAGPFVLEHFSASEEMVLTANENYWGEGPHMDQIRFVPLGGDQARLDALNAGGIDIAFLRDANVIAEARMAGYGGFANVISAGEVLWINNREDYPGRDVRVRKAIAYAYNPKQFNQRVYDGKGFPQKEMMTASSRWATEAKATPYNLEKAQELVAEAKADGFDGKLTLLSSNSPTRQASALTLQAQFNAAGFDVSIETSPTPTALFTKTLEGTFDIAFGGMAIYEAAPWSSITQLSADAPDNYVGYANPKMGSLVDEVRDATTEQDKQRALNEIQKLWTETVPFLSLSAITEFVAWGEDVHGIASTAQTTLLFSQAWLS